MKTKDQKKNGWFIFRIVQMAAFFAGAVLIYEKRLEYCNRVTAPKHNWFRRKGQLQTIRDRINENDMLRLE